MLAGAAAVALMATACSAAGQTTATVGTMASAAALAQAPTDLTVSLGKKNKLTATWGEPVNMTTGDISAYLVYVGDRKPVSLPPDATKYAVKVIPGELLYFQVLAVTQAGRGVPASASVPEPKEWGYEGADDSSKVSRKASSSTPATPTASGSSQVLSAKRSSTTVPTPTPTAAAPAPSGWTQPPSGSSVPAPTVTVTAPPKPAPKSTSTTPPEQDFTEVFRRVKPSVGLVWVDHCDGESGNGTAFFVAPHYLATAAHVIEDASVITVVVDGVEHVGRIAGYDSAKDLALLRIEKPYADRVLPLADKYPVVGTRVAVLGYSMHASYGLPLSMQTGVVSAAPVAVLGQKGLIQTDVQNEGGSSGGPLITRNGTVLGVVSFGLRPIPHLLSDPDVAFMVGSPQVKANIADWMADGPIVRRPSC